MKKDKIAVTLSSFCNYSQAPLILLESRGLRVIQNKHGHKLSSREIIQLCRGCIGIIAGTEQYDKDTLKNFCELKIISRCGVGLENIDMQIAKKMGIRILNTPDAPTLAVAELTVGFMLSLLRKICRMDADVHNKRWKKEMGNLLFRKNVGIIGFGNIGKKVTEILQYFNCNLAYYDPFIKARLPGISKFSLKRLLKWADIVSIHASGKNIILGARQLEQMKKGAWLINTSRGEVLDEGRLYVLLRDKHLSGAALDVFKEEPYYGHLVKLDNVILTPHVGSYAREARIEMEMQAARNVLKGLKLSRRCSE